MMPVITPQPARVRCTACPAEIERGCLDIAPLTWDWLMLDGHWFCPDHRTAAPWIVALDSERNAHQVTLLRLDEARDRIAALEREVETLRFCDNVGLFMDGEMAPAQADAFRAHLARCERCEERLLGMVREHAVLAEASP